MKTILLATAFGFLLALPAAAKTFELPDANPAVTVTLPNSWKPSEVDKGAEATSPDGETYVAVETATAKGMEALIDEDIKFLGEQGVTIDASSQQSQTGTVNGMSVTFLRWTGKDKDGATAITLGIFGVTDNLVLLLTSWSSPAGEKAYDSELTGILQSIKRR